MKLTAHDKDQVMEVIQYAFNKNESLQDNPNFNSRYQHADCYGCFKDDQLTSTIMVNHFEEQVFDQSVKMAGVGYVATLPEYRGMGHIQQLMDEIFHDLHQSGVVLSQLAPFSEAFYRNFGYENTSYRLSYQLDDVIHLLPTEKSGRIVRGRWEDLQAEIKEVYYAVLNSGSEVGSVVRKDWWWDRLNSYYSHRHYAVVYDESDQLCGYLIYRMTSDQFIVDECCYLNLFALRKLSTFIKAHVSSFKHFTYYASLDDLLMSQIREEHQVSVQMDPYMMTRIIDIQPLLTCLPLEDELIIEVTGDTHCPWNNGKWQFSFGKVESVCDKEADVSASIQTWTKFLLGQMSFEEGMFLQAFSGRNVEKVRCIAHGSQHFYDYF